MTSLLLCRIPLGTFKIRKRGIVLREYQCPEEGEAPGIRGDQVTAPTNDGVDFKEASFSSKGRA